MYRIFISTGYSGKDKAEVNKRKEILAYHVSEKLFGGTVDYEYNDIDYDELELMDRYNITSSRANAIILSDVLSTLALSDIVLFDVNWQNYKGCQIEHLFATSYGIRCVDYNWLTK